MNAINVIFPYADAGQWVFDDPDRGLLKEVFVAGADTILDMMVARKGITNPAKGFAVVFSAIQFPGYDYVVTLVEALHAGHVYRCEEFDLDGWLCPALGLYFDEAPQNIYIKLKEIQ